MHSIRHRVGVNAPIDEVYAAVATREGLAGWWTEDTRGESRQGGQIAFHFGSEDARAVMQVTDLDSPKRVEWRCVDGPDEWMDNTITFDLQENGAETAVIFTHAGWREPVAFMHHCSTKWAYFLLGLKSGLEGGKATPFPHDLKIDSWG
jgi:uncharacterized protein YndB with AHSA1/START domain